METYPLATPLQSRWLC